MLLLLCFIIAFISPFYAFGAAFLIYNQDAKANGMAMACASSIDNASAVFFNPANLPTIGGDGILINTTLISPRLYFRDEVTHQKIKAKSKTHSLLSLYAYHASKNWAVGIGLFSPFGLSTEWKKDFPGRYYSLFSSLETIFVNPVFSFKIAEKISSAIGISYISSTFKFKRMIPATDGIFILSGKGDAVGYNLALSYDLPHNLRLSFTFRSPVRIKYEGKGVLTQDPPLPSLRSDSYTYLTLPYLLVFGVSKKTANTTFEIDALYTGWSSMNTYRIKSENGFFDATYHKKWTNTFSLCAGINQRVKSNLSLSFGYMYDVTPVVSSTRGPELPDSTRNIFTFGTTYEKKGFKVSFSYQATYFLKAKSRIQGLLGYYRNFAHVTLLNIGYSR